MELKTGQETRLRIRDQATSLFMKYGIRSVSMDDIAHSLGMSKKTIYQYFADKDELVDAVIDRDIHEMQENCQFCYTESENAIDEIFLTMDRILEQLQNMNPTILYDLQKFHFSAFSKFYEHKNTYLLDIIRNNMTRGIREGLYRADLNVEVLSRFRLDSMMMAFNIDSFPPARFNLAETTLVMMEHFIFGLASQKGYELILRYQQERTKKTNNENR